MAETTEIVVQFGVIIGFAIWSYSRVKRQSIKETIEQIKELVQGIKNG